MTTPDIAARPTRRTLVTTTPYRHQYDFARNYFEQGEAEGRKKGYAEGKAEAILKILIARGIELTPRAAREHSPVPLPCSDQRLDRSRGHGHDGGRPVQA
jgi:hypothetical protein